MDIIEINVRFERVKERLCKSVAKYIGKGTSESLETEAYETVNKRLKELDYKLSLHIVAVPKDLDKKDLQLVIHLLH